jgi:hypothetical protein
VSLAILLLWVSASFEPAATRAVTVGTDACPGLDSAEVERLVELELDEVTREIRLGPALRVELRCDAQHLEIAVDDPLTGKRLSREVPAPIDEPGRERVVALAIAQLFSASWLELLLAEPPVTERDGDGVDIGPVAASGTSDESIHAARRVAETATGRRRDIELLAGAGVRGRSLEAATFAALHLDLELRGWLTPSLGLLGRAGFDFGQADRIQGQVRGHAATAGIGLAWRWHPRPSIGLGGSGFLAGGWARVEGRSDDPSVPTAHTQGATAEATAGIGPRVFFRRFRMDVDAELGGMLRAPEGLVARQQSVTMGGLYFGATLRLGAKISSSR